MDRSLGRRIVAEELRRAGLHVEVHDDHFSPDTKDNVWLRAVGARGWVVITQDQRIRYRQSEIEALMAAGVQAFVITTGNATATETARVFLAAVPAVRRSIATFGRPFVAAINRSSKVRRLR